MHGTSVRPRFVVFRSNRSLYVQLIDDDKGTTILSGSVNDLGDAKKGTKQEKASVLGAHIAKQAKEAGINSVIFDRGSYRYHGRVKAVAEGARKGGLSF